MHVSQQRLGLQPSLGRSVSPLQLRQSRVASTLRQRQASRQAVQAGILDRVTSLFKLPVPALSQVAAERKELLELLRTSRADEGRIDELIDILAESNQPFVEQSIGGGPWKVVYTKGPLLWQQLTSPGAGGRRVRQGGSQQFLPEGRQLVNSGSLLGGLAQVSASGTYELLEDEESSPTLPKTIQANVAGGSIKISKFQLPFPIKGTGTVELLYVDDSIRIFKSPQGSIAVQQKYQP